MSHKSEKHKRNQTKKNTNRPTKKKVYFLLKNILRKNGKNMLKK